MNPIDKFKKPTKLFVDEQTKTHRHQTIEEILSERNGKVEKQEVYFSSKEMITLFPNGYSVVLEQKNSRKYVKVTVYKGISDVTSDFFEEKSNRKVKAGIVVKFLEFIEKVEE